MRKQILMSDFACKRSARIITCLPPETANEKTPVKPVV
jgi:hypothetical protein